MYTICKCPQEKTPIIFGTDGLDRNEYYTWRKNGKACKAETIIPSWGKNIMWMQTLKMSARNLKSRQEWVFIIGNDSKHTSKLVIMLLGVSKTQSLDLSPTGNLCVELKTLHTNFTSSVWMTGQKSIYLWKTYRQILKKVKPKLYSCYNSHTGGNGTKYLGSACKLLSLLLIKTMWGILRNIK